MKKKPIKKSDKKQSGAYIEGSGTVVETDIVTTLEENYMPYAMSVIVSRALPEIDGFKPSHRKLLYTMYKMREDEIREYRRADHAAQSPR